jgi:hypothetical protein
MSRTFFDFSPLSEESEERYDEKELFICREAGEIASRLIQNDMFFENTICKVLQKIANVAGLSGCEPTSEETRSIRDNMPCKVHLTHNSNSYMQCSIDSADIFINDEVLPLFYPITLLGMLNC